MKKRLLKTLQQIRELLQQTQVYYCVDNTKPDIYNIIDFDGEYTADVKQAEFYLKTETENPDDWQKFILLLDDVNKEIKMIEEANENEIDMISLESEWQSALIDIKALIQA